MTTLTSGFHFACNFKTSAFSVCSFPRRLGCSVTETGSTFDTCHDAGGVATGCATRRGLGTNTIISVITCITQTVPVMGAIMVNPGLDKCLLVKSWGAAGAWGFPRGKIAQDETDLQCAQREVSCVCHPTPYRTQAVTTVLVTPCAVLLVTSLPKTRWTCSICGPRRGCVSHSAESHSQTVANLLFNPSSSVASRVSQSRCCTLCCHRRRYRTSS